MINVLLLTIAAISVLLAATMTVIAYGINNNYATRKQASYQISLPQRNNELLEQQSKWHTRQNAHAERPR